MPSQLTMEERDRIITRFQLPQRAAMSFILNPSYFLLVLLAGWINRALTNKIEYVQAENKVLREMHGPKRLLLTDDQRRRLAVAGKALGRKGLSEIGAIFSPDTILRWHRMLVAQKWDFSNRRRAVGRPKTAQAVAELVVRLARENPSWGCDRIRDALANLGHQVCDTTVSNILVKHAIDPAPNRTKKTTWRQFIKSHWDCLAATDFFTTEVWTKSGLVTYYVLFIMELATRRVQIAGVTTNPHEAWMRQMACNLTACDDGFLRGKRYLLMDRDTKFCAEFRSVLEQEGIEPVRLPPRSPNLNAHAERFVRSIKDECLNRLVLFGERMLRHALKNYLAHYHAERNHQGLDSRIIEPEPQVGTPHGEIVCRERLGGLLNYYHRRAA